MISVSELIAALGLRPLAREGGYFRETYRAPDRAPAVPDKVRSLATAIYYLLTPDSFSALHRLPGDEIFHFYLGDPVRMLQLDPAGGGQLLVLGSDIRAGQAPQVVVPRGVWQGSRLADGGCFALLGTTMAPGFDYDDYQAGERGPLTNRYPEFAEWIEQLTP